MHPLFSSCVKELGALGVRFSHKYEALPVSACSLLVNSGLDVGAWGPGLLAFCMTANWGVDWEDEDPIPDDPAGLNWAGQPPRSGKHLIDGSTAAPYGGLGLVHLDSSGLVRDSFGEFGEPFRGASQKRPNRDDYWHFNSILDSEHRKAFLRWADSLVLTERFQFWLADYWIKKYWRPAYEWAKEVRDISTHEGLCEAIELAALNARISNSVKGVGKGLRTSETATVEDQVNGYVGYKLRKRGESQAERALRQANQGLRVGATFRKLRTPTTDALD